MLLDSICVLYCLDDFINSINRLIDQADLPTPTSTPEVPEVPKEAPVSCDVSEPSSDQNVISEVGAFTGKDDLEFGVGERQKRSSSSLRNPIKGSSAKVSGEQEHQSLLRNYLVQGKSSNPVLPAPPTKRFRLSQDSLSLMHVSQIEETSTVDISSDESSGNPNVEIIQDVQIAPPRQFASNPAPIVDPKPSTSAAATERLATVATEAAMDFDDFLSGMRNFAVGCYKPTTSSIRTDIEEFRAVTRAAAEKFIEGCGPKVMDLKKAISFYDNLSNWSPNDAHYQHNFVLEMMQLKERYEAELRDCQEELSLASRILEK